MMPEWENILAETGGETLESDIGALIDAGFLWREASDEIEHFAVNMEVIYYDPAIGKDFSHGTL